MAMQRIPYNIIVHSLSLASLSSSLKEGAKGTSCQREAKSLPYGCGGSQGCFAPENGGSPSWRPLQGAGDVICPCDILQIYNRRYFTMNQLILASGSPRRRELLGLFGIPFAVHAADIDETMDPDKSPKDEVARVSRCKAAAIRREEGDAVIAADTIVVCQGKVLGKPHSRQQAIDMLRLLCALRRPAGNLYRGHQPSLPPPEPERNRALCGFR